MKKIQVLIFCSFLLNTLSAFTAEDKRDWVLDPKTSTLIPKYLGKIKSIKGNASIGERELKVGSQVYNNELIETKDKSFVVMEMIDLTLITLGPLSRFKVENWSYRTKNDREAVFSIEKGQWRALIKSRSKDIDQLKIKTSIVSMGVRGTELLVNAFKEDKKDVTQVALLHGAVHLETPEGNLKKDMLPGEEITVTKDDKGTGDQKKVLTPDEMKSYQQYIAPDVLKLLDPPDTITLSKENAQAMNSEGEKNPEESSNDSGRKNLPAKGLKENLKILNEVREENRKTR